MEYNNFRKKNCLDDLKIANTYELSEESIQNIIDLAKQLKICSGVDASEIDNETNLPENRLKENCANTSQASVFKYRSKHCKGVVTFQSQSYICAICRKLKKKKVLTMLLKIMKKVWIYHIMILIIIICYN